MAYNPDDDDERRAAARDLAKMLLGEARRLTLQFETILTLDPATFQQAVSDFAALVDAMRTEAGAARAASFPRAEPERTFRRRQHRKFHSRHHRDFSRGRLGREHL